MFYQTSFMRMLKNNLGYPRVGTHRELKKACEQYWAGKINKDELYNVARQIRKENWQTQQNAGIDLIPCNDFSFYDHVLDASLMLGVIPQRYTEVLTQNKNNSELDLYFAMARGYQKDGLDITAMEMTKWFDTNYHYIVPEFTANQEFKLFSDKIFNEFTLAKEILGIIPKPVIIGPVSFLLLGKEKEEGFDKIDLIKKLIPVYIEILKRLIGHGAVWVQFDEPFLTLDLSEKEKEAFKYAYKEIKKQCPDLKTLIATYFESLHENISLAVNLPICALHIDLVRAPKQLEEILKLIPAQLSLSLGIIDGRNIWKNDYSRSLNYVNAAVNAIEESRVMIAPSSSLLHVPFDLDIETEINPEIKNWMAFAKQKLNELNELDLIIKGNNALLKVNKQAIKNRSESELIHKENIKGRVSAITDFDATRSSEFNIRQKIQQKRFNLPLFPTTTIGSFPQTDEIRMLRLKLKKGEFSQDEYDKEIEKATINAIRWQEEIGLDVLVHGENRARCL